MAGINLLTLLDDITTLLDDIATMSKVATKKTAGVLGDDLALNAQQVTGVTADRELPVVWAVAKGSFLNKAILVPGALLISVWLPWLITPLLIIGGLFLCFEGAEKVFARFLPHPEKEVDESQQLDPAEYEKQKVKGAIRTDFILSAEIIVITLGTVAGATLVNQALVLCVIAVLMTIGVYGLVAGIVKLDDAGVYLLNQSKVSANKFKEMLGKGLLAAAPRLMQFLAFAGTVAMFLVGGGILSHGIELLHHWQLEVIAIGKSLLNGTGETLAPLIFDGLLGVVAGLCIVILHLAYTKIFNKLNTVKKLINMKKIALVTLIIYLSVFSYGADIDTLVVFSDAMKKKIPTLIVIPDEYENESTFASAVMLLHGYGGNYLDWKKHANLDSIADEFNFIIICLIFCKNITYFCFR